MQKILVAEDSIIVNQHICKTLEGSGYQVSSAFTGAQAVRESKVSKPDLILMDIMMDSKSDGIEAALEIKQEIDVPIIFLTALTDEGTLDRVKDSQPHGYIVKPFNEVELLSNIQVAIHKSKVENEIKTNRDLFQASINSINQAFILLDENKNIFYVNTSGEELIGKKYEHLIGTPLEDSCGIHQSETNDHVEIRSLADISPSDLTQQEFLLKSLSKEVQIGDIVIKAISGPGQSYTLLLFSDISDRIKARELEAELKNKRITSLIEGQENERKRIAREIHDGIGQILNFIKLKVRDVEEGPAKEELNGLLEQTLQEVRHISDNLHPSGLGDFTLEKNIEKLITQLESTAEVKFNFSHSDIPDLDLATKTHLYRIVQESLSNIIKHAHAKESNIQLYGIQDKIQLTIEDDGIGFDPGDIDQTTTHHGIRNIEYRVNSLNGNLTVDSNKESGTMLLISVPFKS